VAAEQQAHRGEQSRRDDARRLREWLTIVALIVTFAVAGYGIWRTHQDTLVAIEETRHGSEQQHQDTLTALSKTDVTIAALQEQAKVMRGQLDELRVEQRPWLYASEIKIGGSLYYTINGIMIPFDFRFKNAGHLPALLAYPETDAFIRNPHVVETNVPEIVRDICNNHAITASFAIFPGDEYRMSRTTLLSVFKINEFWKSEMPNGGALKSIKPYVILCITYRDPGGGLHHTPYFISLTSIENGRETNDIPIDTEKLRVTSVFAVPEPIWEGVVAPD